MLDAATVAEGAIAGYSAEKLKQIIDRTNEKQDTNLSLLRDIRDSIDNFIIWYKNTQAGSRDNYKVVVLWKISAGGPFVINLEDKQYLQIFSPVAVNLNVAQGPLLPFTIGLIIGWNNLTLPDGCTLSLDPGYANNSLNVWARFTDKDIL